MYFNLVLHTISGMYEMYRSVLYYPPPTDVNDTLLFKCINTQSSTNDIRRIPSQVKETVLKYDRYGYNLFI